MCNKLPLYCSSCFTLKRKKKIISAKRIWRDQNWQHLLSTQKWTLVAWIHVWATSSTFSYFWSKYYLPESVFLVMKHNPIGSIYCVSWRIPKRNCFKHFPISLKLEGQDQENTERVRRMKSRGDGKEKPRSPGSTTTRLWDLGNVSSLCASVCTSLKWTSAHPTERWEG